MKKLLTILFLFYCVYAMADERKTHLVIWANDGSFVAYALTEKPKITFTETNMVIISQGVEVNYPLDNMSSFSYLASDESGVRDLKTYEVSFKFEGESLLFHILNSNKNISFHTLDGKLIFSKTVQTAGEYSFPLSNLNAGAYLVTVNGLTYKIVKR